MTQDEIIRMAVECQLLTTSNREGIYAQALVSFAKLVEDKVRQDIIEKNAPVINAINAHVKALEDLLKERGEV